MSSASLTWPSTQVNVAHGTFRKIGLYCLIALIAGMYLFPFMHVLSGATDEGLYVYEAQQALEGAIPGRDFVQENPPGAYYWLALWFRLFGTSMITARIELFVIGVGTILIMLYLARRIGSMGILAAMFVLITSIPLMPINSPHYDSNFFALIAFAVFLAGSDSIQEGQFRYWPFIVAGLLAGWVSCLLQQKGFLFLAAFAASLLFLHRRRGIKACVIMIASYTSVLIAEIIPYVIWGALPDLFLSTVKLPLSGYNRVNQVPFGYPLWTVWFPGLFGHLQANASALVTAPILVAMTLPMLLILLSSLLVAILGYINRPQAFRKQLVPYWIAAYAMWLSELHRQDLSHLRNGCFLLAILFFAFCEQWRGRAFRIAAFVITLGTVSLATTVLNGALHARAQVVTRRGTLYAQAKDPVMEFLLSHTRPGDYVFVYPYAPAYYFLAEVRNPTALNVIVDQRDNSLIEQAIRDLQTKKPRYVLVQTKLLGEGMHTIFPGFAAPAPQDRVIDRYVNGHYHQVAFEAAYRILERNAD